MRLTRLHLTNYRSVRSIHLELAPLTVLVGENGVGKTNVYRGLGLAAAAARGELAATLAAEGGMPSVLWAGERRGRGPVRLVVEVELEELRYRLELGLPQPGMTAFRLDPLVKKEYLTFDGAELLERGNLSCVLRDDEGRRHEMAARLWPSESVLCQLVEPERFGVLGALQRELSGWRFHHAFRTDRDAPLRHPQPGVRTAVLHHDGRDLAAVLQTIRENGDDLALDRRVARAFPGSELAVAVEGARFHTTLTMPGVRRPLDARELSDGTLRYLCLIAALTSPRPPAFVAFNEPETSIHPRLMEPLAELLAEASELSQVLVTTHSVELADALEGRAEVVHLGREASGATVIQE